MSIIADTAWINGSAPTTLASEVGGSRDNKNSAMLYGKVMDKGEKKNGDLCLPCSLQRSLGIEPYILVLQRISREADGLQLTGKVESTALFALLSAPTDQSAGETNITQRKPHQ